MPPRHFRPFVLGFALLAALPLLASAPDSALRLAGSNEALLARWSGGTVSERRFREQYDPEGRFFEQGPKRVRYELGRVLFEEIYAQLAEELGLDRDPLLVARIARERDERLATEWLRQNVQPRDLEVGPAEIEAVYRRDLCTDFLEGRTIEAEVLFLRSGLADGERAAAAGAMQAIGARIERGESLLAVAHELQAANGKVNGHHERLLESELDPRLLAEVDRLLPGGVTPVVESLPGFFRLRLLARHPERPRVRSEIDPILRTKAMEARRQAVELAAAETLRAQYRLPAWHSTVEVLARAAETEGLAGAPRVAHAISRSRQRLLAEAAFFADPKSHPGEAEIARHIAASDAQYRRYRLRVLTYPAVEFAAARRHSAETVASLATSTDAAAALADAARGVPEAAIDDLPELTMAALRLRSATLARALERRSGSSWAGPLAVPWTRLPESSLARDAVSADRAVRSALAFVAVEESRLPAPGELRDDALRARIGELLSDPDRLLAALGERWRLEMISLAP